MRLNGKVKLERPRLYWFKSEDVPAAWDVVKPMIERGIANGSQWTIEEIRERLLSGRMQLWTYGEYDYQAALVTRMTDHCLLLALSGYDMHKWLHHLRAVEGFARNFGCKEMRLHGRRGWSRVLADYEPQGQDELGLNILVKSL